MDSFLYCWTDIKTNMLYVGIHKGCQHDGYVCSSRLMMEAYKERPTDFTRQIVATGNYKDMKALETAILTSENAAKSRLYYNRANNTGHFVNLKHTKETKEKISKSKRGLLILSARGPRPNASGEKNHFFQKKHSEQTRKIMSEKAKIRSIGAGNSRAKSVEFNGTIYSTIKEAAQSTKNTIYTIRKLIATGEIKEIR